MGKLTGRRWVEQIMGMPISLHVSDPLPERELERLAGDVFDWLRHVDAVFSTYKPESEISRLSRGDLTGPGPETAGVLDRCAELWRETDGYFDVYAGGSLDPSGYVKGWSVQVASDRLAAAGGANHFLNAGGDLRVRGEAEPGRPWRIGIENPFQRDRVAWVLEATDLAVATSGTYARGQHVINPHTGRPATELISVTVIGADLGTIDAYATAALAMGEAGLSWLAALRGYPSAAITADGRAFTSADFPAVPPVPG